MVFLNLLFLLSIIGLPITSGLLGAYGDARDVVVLYSGHLAVMSGLNAILWLRASLPHGQPGAVGPIFATVIFIAATLVALVASKTYIAQFILLGAWRRRSSRPSGKRADEIRLRPEQRMLVRATVAHTGR